MALISPVHHSGGDPIFLIARARAEHDELGIGRPDGEMLVIPIDRRNEECAFFPVDTAHFIALAVFPRRGAHTCRPYQGVTGSSHMDNRRTGAVPVGALVGANGPRFDVPTHVVI